MSDAPARPSRRLQFSLRSLVLMALLVASGAGLWWAWEPWVSARAFVMPPASKDNLLFSPKELQFSPDSTRLLIVAREFPKHSERAPINPFAGLDSESPYEEKPFVLQVIDLLRWEVLWTKVHTLKACRWEVPRISWSCDGDWIVQAFPDEERSTLGCVWGAIDGRLFSKTRAEDSVWDRSARALSEHGGLFCEVDPGTGQLQVRNLKTGDVVKLEKSSGSVFNAFSLDSRFLAGSCAPKDHAEEWCRVWDLANGNLLHELPLGLDESSGLDQLAFSCDGRRILGLFRQSGATGVFEVHSGQMLHRFK